MEQKKKKQMILAVSGVKNSGKTTLITALIPELKKMGLQIAVIKHDGHDFQADIPGTDTWKFGEAGACGTLVFSDWKYMMVKYAPVPSEKELIQAFPEADVILLEGFKNSSYPKVEVIRKGNSDNPVCDPAYLCGIATDLDAEGKQQISTQMPDMRFFDLNYPQELAGWIYDRWQTKAE